MACSKLTKLVILALVGLLGSPVEAQYDGSFWWMNPHLIKRAEELREEKDVKAVVVNNVSFVNGSLELRMIVSE